MDMKKFAEITPPWTPQQQLEFAIGFASRPLSRLSPDEWSELSGDLYSFCGGSEPSLIANPTFAGFRNERRGKKAVLSLQAEVKGLLEGVVDAREAASEALSKKPVNPFPPRFNKSITVRLRYSLTADASMWRCQTSGGPDPLQPYFSARNFHVVLLEGALRDVVLSVLIHLITDQPTDKVMRCVCGRLFARSGRQRYCKDPGCAKQRTSQYWAKYITTPKGKVARKKQLKKLNATL